MAASKTTVANGQDAAAAVVHFADLDTSNIAEYEAQSMIEGVQQMMQSCMKNPGNIEGLFTRDLQVVFAFGDVPRSLFVRHVCALKETVGDAWTDACETVFQNLLALMPFKGERIPTQEESRRILNSRGTLVGVGTGASQ